MNAADIIRRGTEQPCLPWVRRNLTRDDWNAMVAALPAQPSLALVTLTSSGSCFKHSL